jgi:hypothetical protein
MNFFKRNKKIFLIIAFIAFVILIAYLIWSVFFKPSEEPTEPDKGGEEITGGLPNAATGSPNIIEGGEEGGKKEGEEGFPNIGPNITEIDKNAFIAGGSITKTEQVTNSNTKGLTSTNSGNVQYYNEDDNYFYRINSNGEIEKLTDKRFYNVDDVTWSSAGDKAVLEYPDGRKIMYNFETDKQVSLQSHWHDFSFSPTGNNLVSKSIGLDPENRWLVVSNDDGSNARAVEQIGENADKVYDAWSPNNQVIALYAEGKDFDRQEVYFVGQNDENFKSTTIEGRGFEPLWSKEGDTLLYSVYNSRDDMNPRLWVVGGSPDNIGQGRTDLALKTWASKCSFANNDEIYCAVPNELPEGAGLFPELADESEDVLYRIDLKNNTKEIIAIPEDAHNVSNIVVPENESAIYFTDKIDGSLYKINLK